MNTEKLRKWHTKHDGFGEKHTSAEWAKILGLHKNTMRRYLFDYGLTVEQIAEMRGVEYKKQAG